VRARHGEALHHLRPGARRAAAAQDVRAGAAPPRRARRAPPPAAAPAAAARRRSCRRASPRPSRPARPWSHPQLCRPCFYAALEDEVHATIVSNGLFRRGERVAVAASGGKDSTVLAHMLTLLNARHE
jgi:hypothetical protein